MIRPRCFIRCRQWNNFWDKGRLNNDPAVPILVKNRSAKICNYLQTVFVRIVWNRIMNRYLLEILVYPVILNSCILKDGNGPSSLQSMGSLGVGHDWVTLLSFFTVTHWRRKWQHTPVFLPGESQGRGSLVGCRLWGRTESDTTEAT